jgi:uncharacterized protein (DUF2062 family)
MAQSTHSLSHYGQAFDTGLVAAALVAAIAVAVCILVCTLTGRCASWHRRLVDRRYVRAGLRELEHYLSAPPRTGPRR